MRRGLWLASGIISVALGTIGIALPLLPTVPFYILAAFCFARSNAAWEARLLAHPRFGPHITAWRTKGAISRKGKLAASGGFAISIAIGAATLAMPWVLAPPLVAALCLSWLWTRPEG
ncbi:MAG: YbaN family protein [Sphingopyxis sp.]